MLCVCIPISRIGRIKRARSARDDSSKYITGVQVLGSRVDGTLSPGRVPGLRMRQGSLGRHLGGLQKASRSLLPSDGLGWASDGSQMGFGWGCDGPWTGLRWIPDGLRCAAERSRRGTNRSRRGANRRRRASEHFIGLRWASDMLR